MKPLRPIQEQALQSLRYSLAKGNKRVVMRLPTGGGKTVIAAHIIQGALDKGKRVIFCVNAISLVDQTVQRFWSDGITAVGVIQGMHEMTDYKQPVQVCSVQTLARRKIPNADLVIVDECFPEGTMISTPKGDIPIQLVSSGDIVYNATGCGIVRSRSVKKANSLVEVVLDDGTKFTCTSNHPIFTERGWTKAGKLAIGQVLVSNKKMQGVRRSFLSKDGLFEKERQRNPQIRKTVFSSRNMLKVLLKEVEKPHAQPLIKTKNVSHIDENWTQAESNWRERSWHDGASEIDAESFGGWLYSRICGEYEQAKNKRWIPNTLQTGHSKSKFKDSHRNRWEFSLCNRKTDSGCKEGQLFSFPRVVSVSHKKQPSGEVVYNLSVSGHPSYYANGILVHNCHNWFEFYGKWMQSWNAIPFIGLSATPYTKGLGKHYQDMVIASSTQELIDLGWLSPFKVYAPSHPDLKGVRTVAGDYNESDLEKAMDKSPLVADIVDTWLKLGQSRPTLCYGVTRAHAKHIQQEFERAGVPSDYIDSYTELEERREIARKFHSGEVKVICNVGVLTTGIDWDVRCIILARPTKSDILFQQIIGRGLRTAEGKDHLVVLDHSDTHLRLGFVTDIEEKYETLCDGKPKEKPASQEKETPLPKECPKCHFLKPPKVGICPACGFKPERLSNVEHIDGELGELKNQKKANRTMTVDQKARFFAELVSYGIGRGYKRGWAANQYRSRFGVYPNKIPQIGPINPSPETLGWITHSNIKRAYGRRS